MAQEKKTLKKKSIGGYILLVLMLVTLIPAIIVEAVSFYTTRSQLIEKNDRLKQTAVNVIKTQRQNLEGSTLVQIDSLKKQSEIKSDASLDKVQQVLKIANGGTRRNITNLMYVNSNGTYTYSNFPMPKNMEILSQDWYQKAKTKGLYWSEPYFDPAIKQYSASVSQKIIDSKGHAHVIAATVSYAAVEEAIADLKVGTSGQAAVITSQGRVLIKHNTGKGNHAFKSGEMINKTAVYKAVAKSNKRKGTIAVPGHSAVGKVTFDKGMPGSTTWTIAQMNDDDLSGGKSAMLLTIALVLLAVIILGYLVSSKMTAVVRKVLGVFEKAFSDAGQGKIHYLPSNKKELEPAKGYFQRMGQKMALASYDGHEFNRVAASYNDMIASVSTLISQVQNESDVVSDKAASLLDLSKQTTTASEEIAQTITEIAEVTGSQAKETTESVDQVQNITANIGNVNANIQVLAQSASEASEIGQNNMDIMDKVNTNWSDQLNGMKDLMESVKQMDSDVQNITKIVNVINDIARQTNLLALNASIEAASAGEAGKGFSVVAAEIRKLAEESNNSTKEIEAIIAQIRNQSTDMVQKTTSSLENGEKQTTLIVDAIKSTMNVYQHNESMSENVHELTSGAAEIVDTQAAILEKLESISASTQENAAGTEEVSANSEEVQATMDEFTDHVANLQSSAAQLKKYTDEFDLEK
ncbi:methyl-accepting chemotaxis sensory transducer [Ligilactobacillus salitolerans]|uniref:Methyl-accepting chemotaxis sensory transducer n=1 Tax=Ligilactobacillus salitolerans TaxID=1808352 RepID=A0A401ITQ9_9LACO|nr:methyl-accepting chemotaxis protein [Ligilactobacillus salitolerans]GBG94898.1 methyl-accepting chemotaxis sensory transducer [Ligilactobacillus salitolerans]